MKLDAYTIVFLRRPVNAPRLPEDELQTLQRAHVAFNARMREAGHVVVNGPFEGQPDESWRGITLYRTPVDEARRLAEDDPLVRAGRLELDIFTWYVPTGLLGDRPAATVEL